MLIQSSINSDTFHSRAVPSRDPDARVLPSGENATEETASPCPCRVTIFRCVLTFQSSIIPSYLPTTSVLPSGENTRFLPFATLPSCNVAKSFPVEISHSFSPSNVPEARIAPSGENATAKLEVSRSVETYSHVSTSHNLTPSFDPTASVLLSGEKGNRDASLGWRFQRYETPARQDIPRFGGNRPHFDHSMRGLFCPS